MHDSHTLDVTQSKVKIRESLISGKGSFAKEKIAAGQYITTLTGKPIVTDNINALCVQNAWRIEDPLQVGDNTFLILDYASKIINHSCNPNAGLRNTSDLYAIRDIAESEEVVYDYSTTCGTNDIMHMLCSCSAPNCRSVVGNVLSIPPSTLAKYNELNALPYFIKLQLHNCGKFS